MHANRERLLIQQTQVSASSLALLALDRHYIWDDWVSLHKIVEKGIEKYRDEEINRSIVNH